MYILHERLLPGLFPLLPLFLFVLLEDLSLGAGGTFAPSSLASDKPIAIAWRGLVTFLPLLPLYNSPLFISCIFSSTSSCDFFEYLAIKSIFKVMKYSVALQNACRLLSNRSNEVILVRCIYYLCEL